MTPPPFRRHFFCPKRKTDACRPDSLHGNCLWIGIDNTPSDEWNQEEFRVVTGFHHNMGRVARARNITASWMHHAADCPEVMETCLVKFGTVSAVVSNMAYLSHVPCISSLPTISAVLNKHSLTNGVTSKRRPFSVAKSPFLFSFSTHAPDECGGTWRAFLWLLRQCGRLNSGAGGCPGLSGKKISARKIKKEVTCI